MHLVQLVRDGRRVAGVAQDGLVRLVTPDSVYQLALEAASTGQPLSEVVSNQLTSEVIDPSSEGWRWLPPVDHPEPARCLVSGTGLTHESSAKNRQAMHLTAGEMTDSMRMYLWGVEGGRPEPGKAGVAPEWFYKGNGSILKAHMDPLTAPWHGEDSGEEAELAGVYMIGPQGEPLRIGVAQGNEFSDHVHERRNYLYLAESKLRECSLGPELCIGPGLADVHGEAWIERGGAILWKQAIRSGDAAMSHSLANIEHHHFKHAAHRRPGDLHVHFFGASAFSFGEGIALEDGDVMCVSFEGFGRPLRNPLRVERAGAQAVQVRVL